MGLHDFFDTPPTGSQPAPRLTPRSPLSIKELTAILVLGALVWGAYDRLNKFAEKSAVDHLSDTMWQQRMETQHNFDVLHGQLDKLIEAQEAQRKLDYEKRAAEARRK